MKARNWISVLLALSLPAGAVEITGNNPPDGLRGILQVPTLFGSGPCTPRPGGKYTLRALPTDRAAALGTLEAEPIAAGQNACSQDLIAPRLRKAGDTWTSPVPVREFRRGSPGLVVTDVRGGWAHVMLADGEAWMQLPPGAVAHEYGVMVALQPVHALRGWDGRVCTTPQRDQCRKMAMPSNPAMRITRMQTIGDELWFKVEFGIGGCEGATTPGRDVLQGWIPGFGPPGIDGRRPLTLWMDARGC